jgi:hypothetical protein
MSEMGFELTTTIFKAVDDLDCAATVISNN